MESQIKIFESGKADGIISSNKKFYKDGMTLEERQDILRNNRIKLGQKYNFNGLKMFQALQKNPINGIEYEDGKYIVLNETHMKKEDYWEEKLPADILIISKKYPKIVVGNQMADCPILIVEDRKLGVTALSHCGASYINRKLPMQTVESLIKEFNSNINDLYVYIGSYSKESSYVYDKYPKWATNEEVWKNSIKRDGEKYYIDLGKAIIEQLKQLGIKNITLSKNDTVTNDNYYSHIAECKGIKEKTGQNFVGFYYI